MLIYLLFSGVYVGGLLPDGLCLLSLFVVLFCFVIVCFPGVVVLLLVSCFTVAGLVLVCSFACLLVFCCCWLVAERLLFTIYYVCYLLFLVDWCFGFGFAVLQSGLA